MWQKLTLRKRIYALLTALIMIAVTGGLIIVWHTVQIQRLTSVIIEKNIAAIEIAEALETALVNQKGFVTYYLLDRDPNWLRRFGEYRQIFNTQLDQAQKLAQNQAQQETIAQIAHGYETYITLKDRVIDFYKAGELKKGAQLHKTVRLSFFLQTEKMATVGKLAAGMAHSIRNPFTSVKMRLFSLSRSLDLDTDRMEDFEVISQEIRHIDTIVWIKQEIQKFRGGHLFESAVDLLNYLTVCKTIPSSPPIQSILMITNQYYFI